MSTPSEPWVAPSSDLARETNWWGAFVIGLAGTILVTGIAPYAVSSLGAASVPLFIGVTGRRPAVFLLGRACRDDAGPAACRPTRLRPTNRSVRRWPGTPVAFPAGPTGLGGSRSRRST